VRLPSGQVHSPCLCESGRSDGLISCLIAYERKGAGGGKVSKVRLVSRTGVGGGLQRWHDCILNDGILNDGVLNDGICRETLWLDLCSAILQLGA
jgi:hypothetical protein